MYLRVRLGDRQRELSVAGAKLDQAVAVAQQVERCQLLSDGAPLQALSLALTLVGARLGATAFLVIEQRKRRGRVQEARALGRVRSYEAGLQRWRERARLAAPVALVVVEPLTRVDGAAVVPGRLERSLLSEDGTLDEVTSHLAGLERRHAAGRRAKHEVVTAWRAHGVAAGAHSGERWRGQAASRRAGCCRSEKGCEHEHHARSMAANRACLLQDKY